MVKRSGHHTTNQIIVQGPAKNDKKNFLSSQFPFRSTFTFNFNEPKLKRTKREKIHEKLISENARGNEVAANLSTKRMWESVTYSDFKLWSPRNILL